MKEKIIVEKIAHEGTVESALDGLKNNKTVQEELKGFKVISTAISGGKVMRTITINLINEDIKSELGEALDALLKNVVAALIKEAQDKQEKTHD